MNKQQQVADILRGAMQPEPEVQPEVAPVVEETVEEAPVEEQVPDSVESPVETEEASSKAEPVETPDSANIGTLSELATAIEVDNEFLYNIKVPIGDGLEPVSISQLKDTYKSKSEAIQAREAELEQQREAFRQEREQQETQMSQSMLQAHEMPAELMEAEAEIKALQHSYNTFDWASLEQSDPGRAALLKQNLATEFAQAKAKAEGIKSNLQQAQQSNMLQLRNMHEKELLRKVPEWTNPEVRQAESQKLRTVLSEYGFNEQEIGSLFDNRTVKLVHDLMKLKTKQTEVDNAKAVVMKAPKVLKPGTTRVAPNPEQKLRAQLESAKKSKDSRVKVKAIGDLLNVNNINRR